MQLIQTTAISFVLAGILWIAPAVGSDELRVGQRYEIVGELYAYGVTKNLNTRQLSLVSLSPLHLSGPEIVSKQSIQKGTRLTIVKREPKGFPAFLYTDRYVVLVDGLDASATIPVVIDICCGIQGKSTPLDPTIFKALD